MAYGKRLFMEAVREIAFGSISGTYAAVGTATTHNGRVFILNNSTNVDLYCSIDGTTNHFRVASNGFKLIDVMANQDSDNDDAFELAIGTTFYVKSTSAGDPTSGNFWVELIAEQGGP